MWPATSDKWCWFCCHPFDNVPALLPRLLKSNVFEFTGNFCSWNCVKAYAISLDNRKPKGVEYIGIFAYLTVHRPQYCHVPVRFAHPPDCQCLYRHHGVVLPKSPRDLQAFGGNLSITEFRRNFHRIHSLRDVTDVFVLTDGNDVTATISRPYLYYRVPPTSLTVSPKHFVSVRKRMKQKYTSNTKTYEEEEDDEAPPVVHVPRTTVVNGLSNYVQTTQTYP